MKRLILSLGIFWALIYTANHTLFMRASSNPEVKIATSSKQASTDQQVNSWGPYLPHVRSPLPSDLPTVSPSEPRQPREVATGRIEAVASTSAKAPFSPKTHKSVIGGDAGGDASKKASLDHFERPVLKPSAAVPRKAKKPHSPEYVKPPLAQASAQQHSPLDVGSPRQRRGVGLFMFAPPGF
jgi:hypothetical protein